MQDAGQYYIMSLSWLTDKMGQSRKGGSTTEKNVLKQENEVVKQKNEVLKKEIWSFTEIF